MTKTDDHIATIRARLEADPSEPGHHVYYTARGRADIAWLLAALDEATVHNEALEISIAHFEHDYNLLVIGLLQLGRRGVQHAPVRAVAALLLVAVSPYVMWSLAQGITPPATGVGVALWLSWQVTLTAAGAAIGLTAALLLGPGDDRRAGWAAVGAGLWVARSSTR